MTAIRETTATKRRRFRQLFPERSDYLHLSRHWHTDLLAGLTVAVVALPLALGFGIASGLGAFAGLITSIIAPYSVTAIGDPGTLQTALTIPGGVSQTLESLGGTVSISQQNSVTIRSVRVLPSDKNVKPQGR